MYRRGDIFKVLAEPPECVYMLCQIGYNEFVLMNIEGVHHRIGNRFSGSVRPERTTSIDLRLSIQDMKVLTNGRKYRRIHREKQI